MSRAADGSLTVIPPELVSNTDPGIQTQAHKDSADDQADDGNYAIVIPAIGGVDEVGMKARWRRYNRLLGGRGHGRPGSKLQVSS